MKKVYSSPIVECMNVVPCGVICGLSGDNNSGQGAITTNPEAGGSGTGGWGAPHRVFF